MLESMSAAIIMAVNLSPSEEPIGIKYSLADLEGQVWVMPPGCFMAFFDEFFPVCHFRLRLVSQASAIMALKTMKNATNAVTKASGGIIISFLLLPVELGLRPLDGHFIGLAPPGIAPGGWPHVPGGLQSESPRIG